MFRSFLGTLGALGVVSCLGAGRYAAAAWVLVVVALASIGELLVGVIRRRLVSPARATRRDA